MNQEDFRQVLNESLFVIAYELENIRHILDKYHADNRSESDVLRDPDNNRFYESQEHSGTEPIDQ